MTKKSTKSALFTSAISLLLCFSMLLGTTFAWFTDSVTSANNIIKSGNLDVEFEYWNGEEWKTVQDASDILTNELWEPGVTEVAYLRVANKGSLALKYQLGVNIVSETAGVNAADEDFNLSDYIYFDVVEDVNGETNAYATREAAMEKTTETTKISAGYSKDSTMEAGSDPLYLALIVYMPETVGNEANHDGTNVPEIDLGINVYAAQLASEVDSFGSDYDENAKSDKPVKVASAEELKDVLENITEKVVIDATGVTLEITEEIANGSAVAIEIPAGVTIKGATFSPTFRGGNYILMSAGANEQVVFENCIFDNADKSLVIGSTADGPESVIYNNCTFTGSVITNFVDNPDGVAEFNSCTFKKSSSGSAFKNFVEGMGGTHNFNNCTFDYTGVTQTSMGVITSGCVNVYSESEYSTTVVLNGCTRINCGTRTYGPNSSLIIK